MQTLTLAEVILKGREAFEAGLLMAQHPTRELRRCVYHNGNYHCVIGSALFPTTISKIHEEKCNTGTDIYSLVRKHIIDFSTDDKEYLKRLQSTHDDWCEYSRLYGNDNLDTFESRTKFLNLLYCKS